MWDSESFRLEAEETFPNPSDGANALADKLRPGWREEAATKKAQAREVARMMLEKATGTRMYYGVIVEPGCEPPFQYQWRRKNIFGVTFNVVDERSAAEEWIATALLAGICVFHSTREECRGGTCPKEVVDRARELSLAPPEVK